MSDQREASLVERISADISAYVRKLQSEQEFLIAKYMEETGLKPSEIVIVVRDHDRFYPAPRDPQLDDIAPEIRRWKDRALEAEDRASQLEETIKLSHAVKQGETIAGLRERIAKLKAALVEILAEYRATDDTREVARAALEADGEGT